MPQCPLATVGSQSLTGGFPHPGKSNALHLSCFAGTEMQSQQDCLGSHPLTGHPGVNQGNAD